MPRDAFDVLGVPATFDLGRDVIERAYLKASRRLHPDAVGGGLQAQAAAEGGTAELNRAAGVLRDPELRANALLARLGGPSKEADRSLPDGFLQDMLEMRMEIESARGDAEATARWEAWAQQQREEYIRRCSALFAGATGPGAAAGKLADIRRTLNAWRYIERLIEQLDPGYDPARADLRSPG